jgi:hypothetical protein
MTQKRIQDFGSPVVASSLKKINSAFVPPGILKGFEFLADSPSRLRVNPGVALTNQGVLIIEDEFKYLTLVNTSTPVDYTVFYDHNDQDVSGGVAANLTIQQGLLTASVIKGVILGYIRYPGGATPLSSSHFIQQPPLQIGSVQPKRETADWLIPIKSKGYMVTGTTGGVITITDTFDISGSKPEMYVRFRNNALVSGAVTLTFPFKVNDLPYANLQMLIGTDVNASLTPSIIDSTGASESLGASFSGNPGLVLHTISIPRNLVQTPNSIIYLQLELSMAVNREVKIQALGLNTFNLPI